MKVGMYPDPYINNAWHKEANPIMEYLANSIESKGWQVEPLMTDEIRNPKGLRSKGIDAIHLHWPNSLINFGRRRFRLVDRILPEPIVQQLFKALVDKWSRSISRLNIPIVWEVHDMVSHHLLNERSLALADEYLYRTFFKISKGIVVHEESCLDPIFSLYGSTKPYAIAYLGDFSIIYGAPFEKHASREKIGIKTAGKVISFIGSYRENRNPAEVVDAFLNVAGQDDSLVVAGGGVEQVVAADIDPRVLVFSGLVPKETIRLIFSASDFVVNHAKRYLTSAVIRSSMSYGTPVIAYAYGSAIDMAKDAAVFIEDGDDGLKRAIYKALTLDDHIYQQLVQAAFARNSERTWIETGAACTGLYETLLSQN